MQFESIQSRKNPLIRAVASLSEKKEREESGRFLCEGITLLKEAVESGLVPEEVFVSEKSFEKWQAPLEELFAPNQTTRFFVLPDFVFERITTEKGNEGIVSTFLRAAVLPKEKFSSEEKILVLERIQDPGNVGTMLRTASAFGFGAVWMTGCADPFGARAARASMGALFRIPIRLFADSSSLMDALEESGFFSVAACLSPDAGDIRTGSYQGRVAILIGNEGQGLSDCMIARSHERRIIPIENMESLNAAAAAAVFLWEIRRKKD